MKTIYKYLIAFFAIILPIIAYGASETSNPYDKVTQGKSTATDKDYIFNIGAGAANPRLRAKASTNKLQFAHDGTTFKDIGSGSGAGGGGVVLNANTGFEEGLTSWTASGGTFTLETTAANVGFATQAGAWDASAASQTLSNDAITVPAGLFGKTCSLSWYYKGGDGNLKAQVYDGTNIIAESSALSAQATYSAKQVIYFTCPSSGTMLARFIASADAAIVYIDDVKLGQEQSFNGQPQNVLFKGKHDDTCTWTAASTVDVWVDPASDASCVFSTQKNTGFGTITALGAVQPGYSFTVPHTGVIEVCAWGSFVTNNTNDYTSIRIVDEDITELAQVFNLTSGSSSASNSICGYYDATKGDAATLKLQVKTRNGTSTLTGFEAGNFNADAINWTMKYVSFAQTTEAISVEQTGWRVDVNIGGAQPQLSTASVSSYTGITNSGLDMVIAPGSASAEIPCSSTNPSTGLTCAAGDEQIGIVLPSLPSAGTYEVCAAFASEVSGTGIDVSQTFQWGETSNTSQTILNLGGQRSPSRISGADTTQFPLNVCGQFTFADTSKRTLRLFYTQNWSSGSGAQLPIDRSSGVSGGRDMRISVRRRVEFADVIKIDTSSLITAWQSYTPTFTGFGTVTVSSFWWRRVKDSIEIRGNFISGTPTAVEARISLPSGLTSDGSKLSTLNTSGYFTVGISSSSHGGFMLMEPSVGYVTFGSHSAFSGNTVNAVAKVNANTITSTGDILYFTNIVVPIQGY